MDTGEDPANSTLLEQEGLSFLQKVGRETDSAFASALNSAEQPQGRTPGADELVTQIRGQGKDLRSTLRSVGTLARLSEDQTTLVPEKVDAVELAQGLLDDCGHSAREHGLALALEVPDSPIEMTTDADALRRALQPLLSIAGALTPDGEVTVHVDATDAKVEFRVENTSDGGRAAALSSLVEAFVQQGAEGGGMLPGGLGLELSLARGLARHLGGAVEVTNDPEGRGVLTLRVSRHLTGVEASGANGTEEKPPRLLIVEDNEVTQRLLRLMLEADYRVDVVAEAGAAIQKAEESAYDAFVLDMNLNGRRTGVEVLHAAQKMDRYTSVPAVACTAYALDDHREQFLRVGFDDVIAKPVTKREILDVIDRALEASSSDDPSSSEDGKPDLSMAGIELPPIPTTLVKVAELASSDPDAHDVEALTEALQKDQVVSQWLIRHINSAYYSLRESIETVERAVRYLGFRPVCNLVLTKVIGESFSGAGDPAVEQVQTYIMKTSTLTAFIAREVAEQFGFHAPEVAYTGGMFAQIGRLALLEAEDETYVDLWFDGQDRTAAFEGPPPQGREILHYEEDYVRKGRAVGKACSLSNDLKAVIRAHRRPTQVDEQFQPLVPIVALGLRVAHLVDHPEEEHPWGSKEALKGELRDFKITRHLTKQGPFSQQKQISAVVDAAEDARKFVGQI